MVVPAKRQMDCYQGCQRSCINSPTKRDCTEKCCSATSCGLCRGKLQPKPKPVRPIGTVMLKNKSPRLLKSPKIKFNAVKPLIKSYLALFDKEGACILGLRFLPV